MLVFEAVFANLKTFFLLIWFRELHGVGNLTEVQHSESASEQRELLFVLRCLNDCCLFAAALFLHCRFQKRANEVVSNHERQRAGRRGSSIMRQH